MRHPRKLKSRLNTLPTLVLCLLALCAPFAPAGAQDAAQPKVVAQHVPAYPPSAVAARAWGKVVVEVRIDEGGGVSGAEVKSGHPMLRKAAAEAAARWRFEPAARGGGERTAALTFEFDLDPGCGGAPVFRTPYHAEVRPTADAPLAISDTESHIPEGSEGKRCPVHRLRLARDKVEIIYGLVMFDPDYFRAEERRFPYASTAAYGGCVIEMFVNPCDGRQFQRSPKYAEVLYCPRCRAAKRDWEKRHKGPRG